MPTINIARDYYPSPAGRIPSDGPFNGEKFRDEFLAPALKKPGDVTVILDGVDGFGSSFLEEAFGGLVRKRIISREELEQRLKLVYDTNDPELAFYAKSIKEFVKEAIPE